MTDKEGGGGWGGWWGWSVGGGGGIQFISSLLGQEELLSEAAE